MPVSETIHVPGTDATVEYSRTETGRLIGLRCGGRTYLHEAPDGARVFSDGHAIFREANLPRGLLRTVSGGGRTWSEEYLWNAAGKPTRIDGVEIERDEQGRITACRADDTVWRYGYARDHLAVIDGPHGTRYITTNGDGRPVAVRERGVARPLRYDPHGKRLDAPRPPATWHRDRLGRLWSITRSDGSLAATYLWNGLACLARIDGAPGEDLAAVFSLDLSCTPVRVITREGVRRVPRDAFGESLLDVAGAPGLYGGGVQGGFVHLRGRALDPVSGAFDRADPFDGLSTDPRRGDGFDGELPVDHGAPYTVCRNDPIGRIDPTGEISVPLLLSDFTWSIQNNLGGWFGMDFTLNFWIDMLSFGAGGLAGKFFSFEGVASERSGSFGVRRDGVFAGSRAFTFQHEVWNSAELFDANVAQSFDPGGPFRPSLYGTLLRGVPTDGAPFLLSGNTDPALNSMNWTRHGGTAEPVTPGAAVSAFPSGGLHFDTPIVMLNGRIACKLTELVPSGTLVAATVAQASATLILSGTGLPLAVGGLVLLTDAATGVDVKAIASVTPQGANTLLRLEDATITVAATGVRLRGLGAPGAAETLTPVAPPGSLGVTGSTAPYSAGDALRLSQNGTKVGAVVVAALEARLRLDGALPPGLATPLAVHAATAPGTPAAASLAGNVLTIAGGPLPGNSDTIVVAGGGTELGAVVVDSPTATTRTLDRTVADLTPLGAAVTWRPMASGLTLGTAATVDAAATLTFNPAAPRTAPTSGFLIVEAAGSPIVRAARKIAGLDYDALVTGAALPGNPAAAYQVERIAVQPPDLPNLTITSNPGLTLPPGITLPGTALQLNQLTTPAIAAGGPGNAGATITGATAALTGAVGGTFTPSQLLVLQRGTTLGFAVISRLRVTIVLDRVLTFDPAGAELVPLQPTGFNYAALARDPLTVTVLPLTGATPVQMPRIAAGETVQVAWTAAPAGSLLFRVAAVSGETLTLEGDGPIPPAVVALPAAAAGLTVQRLIPSDPNTGSARLGIRGAPAAASSNTVTFDVWTANAFRLNQSVGIATGNRTLPARVTTPQQAVFIDLTAPPAMGNGVTDLTIPGVTTFYAPGFTQSGIDVILPAAVPPLPAVPSTNLTVVVPYVDGTASAAGKLASGSMKVPEDPEHWELDVRDSLRDHELTHTLQAATWGPLFLGWLPLFAIEGLLEGVTDIELPEFSAYVPATVVLDNGNSFLTIPDAQGIDFGSGTNVQISSATLVPRTVALGAKDATGRISFANDGSIAAGAVQIRRQTGDNNWTKLRDFTYNLLHILTVGGVLNLVAGSAWGGLIFGIGKLIYFLRHRVFHAGDEFPATIESDGAAVRMSSAEGKAAVFGFNSIVIKSPNDSVERDLTAIADDLLTLKDKVTFTGAVNVIPYKTDDSADGLDFYPATVPAPDRPASIKPGEKNGATLSLHVFDRVAVAAGITSRRTNVTAVNADGTVDLAEPPPITDPNQTLRVAKVDERDPMGGADSRLLTNMRQGWMRWLFDPYGQFQYRLHPTPGSPADWIARIARYLLSTHSWSAALPGHLFWDDLFHQPNNNGHLSSMEQDASQSSGNLYSPLGRIRGGFARQDDPFATYTATVGDVARYWLALMEPTDGQGRAATPTDGQVRGKRDAPGVQINRLARVIANVQSGAGAGEPNKGAQSSDTAHSGRFVPDALFAKNAVAAAPEADDASLSTPPGFTAADRGLLPTSPVLTYSTGIYAAFSRPGLHRITVQDGIISAQQGREAQENRGQTLWFDVLTSDVAVQVAGTSLAWTDPPTVLTMIPRQKAAIVVGTVPDPARRYAATVTTQGRHLTVAGLSLIGNDDTTEMETVEISRVYRFDGTSFDDAVLNAHGMHLPADLHIPVRQFTVTLTTTLPVRAGPDQAEAIVATLQPGQSGFILVPASVAVGLARGAVTYAAPQPPDTLDPAPAITLAATPAAAAGFIGDGAIFQIAFDADDPTEEAATVAFSVSVGQPGNSVALSASVANAPWFRLTAPAFSVARGASLVLDCTDGVQAGAVAVTPPDGVTVSQALGAVTLAVDAAAAPGVRRVLVADGADTTHKARRSVRII